MEAEAVIVSIDQVLDIFSQQIHDCLELIQHMPDKDMLKAAELWNEASEKLQTIINEAASDRGQQQENDRVEGIHEQKSSGEGVISPKGAFISSQAKDASRNECESPEKRPKKAVTVSLAGHASHKSQRPTIVPDEMNVTVAVLPPSKQLGSDIGLAVEKEDEDQSKLIEVGRGDEEQPLEWKPPAETVSMPRVDAEELIYYNQHPKVRDEAERRRVDTDIEGKEVVVFTCEFCEKVFFTPAQLTAHRWSHTRPFACDMCVDRFPTKGTLVIHRRKHTGEKPFACNACEQKFSTRSNLRRHAKTHTGERPFECEVCHQRFTEKKSMKIHFRKHTGERPFECKICGKAFSQSGILNTHLLIHEEKNQEKCELCGKTFRQRFHLKTHLLRHKGVKNFACDQCQSAFLTKSDLERHLRTHTGARPYKCDLCDKSFARQQTLQEHTNRHLGAKPYTCSVCTKTFPEMSQCYKHMKTAHTLEEEKQNQIMIVEGDQYVILEEDGQSKAETIEATISEDGQITISTGNNHEQQQ